MGYMHINNLYKDVRVLEQGSHVYCLEKIHGTSAHIAWRNDEVSFFSGGCKHSEFVKLFDEFALAKVFAKFFGGEEVIIYGEAFGGKLQGMSELYGKELQFEAFDVKLNGSFINVPDAKDIVELFNLIFVQHVVCKSTVTDVDAWRDFNWRKRQPGEGIVIRPTIETIDVRGNRVIAKHKRAEFCETKTPRDVDPDKLLVLADARKVADEWVTPMRLQHVLNGREASVELISEIIPQMQEDVKRESEGEVVWSKAIERAIGSATAILIKKEMNEALHR